MKYSLVNDEKKAPEPKMTGVCPFCGAKVISKCGNKNVWHWAHATLRNCDKWWENETEWHRQWKNHFPVEWQEVIHKADDGEKHIADVKTVDGCTIEFQHSFICPKERESRDSFYPNLVWIVDGKRRKRDEKQFFEALKSGTQIMASPLLIKVYIDECKLIDEWQSSTANVFFDFGEKERIWWLLPIKDEGCRYIIPFAKNNFIELHSGKSECSFINFLSSCLKNIGFILDNRNKLRILPSNYLSQIVIPKSFYRSNTRRRNNRRF